MTARYSFHDLSSFIDEILSDSNHAPELSESEVAHLNDFDSSEASHLLIRRLKNSPNAYVRSRAFDGLMRLNEFDQINFLKSELETCNEIAWRVVYVEALGELHNPEVSPMLCNIIINDHDDDIRYIAARLLNTLGDAEALPSLDYVTEHDIGVDYEGRPVAAVAWEAAQRIRGEAGVRRSLQEWMDSHPSMPLHALVASLDTLGNYLTIFGSGDKKWGASSYMRLVPPTSYRNEIYDRYDLRYFLEVVQAKQILNEWRDERAGRNPTPDEACEVLLNWVRERDSS